MMQVNQMIDFELKYILIISRSSSFFVKLYDSG